MESMNAQIDNAVRSCTASAHVSQPACLPSTPLSTNRSLPKQEARPTTQPTYTCPHYL